MVKLFQAGLLPQSYALGKLGYSDDDRQGGCISASGGVMRLTAREPHRA
ncbi:MAG: hypothetical protein U5N53_10530 [Mycobacterium sp.]|nr:hypothetical protein [Mycobacterium sp.]